MWAIVTGSGSKLGREIAIGLARQGYSIVLHYFHSEQAAHQTAEAIRNLSQQAVLIQADLTREDSIHKMFDEISSLAGGLDVLVNSASIMPASDIRTMTSLEWDAVMDLNVKAAWLCARKAARLMESRGGIIINMGDAGIRKTWMKYPAYLMSKAAIEMLTRLLARAYAPAVRVNAVAPGLVIPDTSFPAEEWDKLVDRLPMKRAAAPAEIVDAISFLIHHPYITGETIVVDGGYQLI